MTPSTGRSIERWSPTLFLLAGALLVAHAAAWWLRLVTDASAPSGVFAAAGHLVGTVALAALYPALADRTPRLARAAVVSAAVPAAGWFAITTELIAETVGMSSPRGPPVPPAFYVAVLASTVAAYVLFTVAGRRARLGPRTLVLLLLAPAALLVARVGAAAVDAASDAAGFAIGAGLGLSLLALGFALRRVASTDRGPAARGTAG
ncbi:hypothetical protein [Halosimplex amylolyticum]|uniref:hypothetical protein n=1 Tax=Halosimplex amylolyticum TaxID=3396616 RepID=UPI003F54A38E